MSKIIVLVLLTLFIFCKCVEEDQVPESEPESVDRSESSEDKDKYDLESKQDYDKTSEKEKELKLLRKAKRLKESNYRRALDNILPAKNTEGYRKFFEELINNSNEKNKADNTQKEVEDVIVTDTFVDGESNGSADFDPSVEEIEVVIEHITDNDNDTDTDITQPPDMSDHRPVVLSEDGLDDLPDRNLGNAPLIQPTDNSNQSKAYAESRTGHLQDNTANIEVQPLQAARFEDRRQMEHMPISRISEVVIPHYRTTLTRSGVMVSPALYTVQTTSPIIDHLASRNWLPNRGIASEIFRRSSRNQRGDMDTKLIDDYNEYGGNAYSYAPSKSQLPSRQSDMLAKIAEASLQPHLGNINPFRDNQLYPSAYYPQAQRYYPNSDSFRPLFRVHR